MSRPTLERIVFYFILLLFVVRNLPWHLDDYDQAKQAYVSFEMVERGAWFFQQTPRAEVATKPPLVGWISAILFTVLRSWELAWRLPPFLAGLAILLILRREGNALCLAGGLLAIGCFGLNTIAPRLATLVRTDMVLALLIFIPGWLIWRHLRDGTAWTSRDRWLTAVAVFGAMMTKGPILYAFLLPGLIAFQLLRRRRGWESAWCGWWPWLLPLIPFGAWVTAGALWQPGFYEQVIGKEFLGRFEGGTDAVHRSQPVYFYLHLLHRIAPWTLLLAGVFLVHRRMWRESWKKPEIAWLWCWILGAFVLMSLIPSKRVDRVFPLVPPLGLLLAGTWGLYANFMQRKGDQWVLAATGVGAVLAGGYTVLQLTSAYKQRADALTDFGTQVRLLTRGEPLAVVKGKDEGMLLYCRTLDFSEPDDAAKAWKEGKINSVVFPEKSWRKRQEYFPSAQVTSESAETSDPAKQSRYVLIQRH